MEDEVGEVEVGAFASVDSVVDVLMRVGRKVAITCEQTQMAFILVPSSHDDDHARGHCWRVCAYTCNRNVHSEGARGEQAQGILQARCGGVS